MHYLLILLLLLLLQLQLHYCKYNNDYDTQSSTDKSGSLICASFFILSTMRASNAMTKRESNVRPPFGEHPSTLQRGAPNDPATKQGLPG